MVLIVRSDCFRVICANDIASVYVRWKIDVRLSPLTKPAISKCTQGFVFADKMINTTVRVMQNKRPLVVFDTLALRFRYL